MAAYLFVFARFQHLSVMVLRWCKKQGLVGKIVQFITGVAANRFWHV